MSPVLVLMINGFSENVLSSHIHSSVWNHFRGISGSAVVDSAGRGAFQTGDVSWGSWEALPGWWLELISTLLFRKGLLSEGFFPGQTLNMLYLPLAVKAAKQCMSCSLLRS